MTFPRSGRLAAAVATLVLMGLTAPGGVLAHAELDTATPADKAIVVGPPAEVVMTFTQHLDPARSNIKLVNASGAVVAEVSTVGPDALTMRLAVPNDLPAGAYTARWVSFSSDDNEQARGTTTFTVTAPTPPPTLVPSASPPAAPSASSSIASVAPTVAAPSPSAAPTTPTASASDALIPIVVVVVAILGLGAWFFARSRRAA